MIYLIAGQSATGKTTQANILNQDENFHKIVSYTTRDKRKNEKDGIDYHFISTEKFKDLEKNNFFVAPVKYSGNYYGIAKKDLAYFRIYEATGHQVTTFMINDSLEFMQEKLDF